MKNSTLTSLYAYFCQHDTTIDVATLTADIETEYQRIAAQRETTANLYSAVLATVREYLTDEPQTGADLYEQCKDALPEDFTRGQFNYLLRKYPDVFVKHDNGRNPKTYTKS